MGGRAAQRGRRGEGLVKRGIATAVVIVLGALVAPQTARAPRLTALAWDLFAVDHQLAALDAGSALFALGGEGDPLAQGRGPAAIPEPAGLVLGALGVTALAAARRRRFARARSVGPRRPGSQPRVLA